MEVNLNYTYRKLPGRNVVQEVVYNEQEWGGTIPVNDSMSAWGTDWYVFKPVRKRLLDLRQYR